jgi:indolepyruvate ferredoxin oxidoreductase beta subunit
MQTSVAPLKRPITLAIFAMGGEGGGVLADWLIDLAEHSGYVAQLTSVPGVAQRTGATNYYLELFPRAKDASAASPVMALIPMPGDVDIVIASELMEAGRAIQRGLVTPDRTVLITSTSRVYAMTEKTAMADGRIADDELIKACRDAARKFHGFDMAAAAETTGSVISAVLFGALAGSGVLPFERRAYEEAVKRGGVGIGPSLAAFAAGFDHATSQSDESVLKREPAAGSTAQLSAPARGKRGRALPADLLAQIETIPSPARNTLRHGIMRTADYQGIRYAALYLGRIRKISDADSQYGDGSYRLLIETARQLALGMAYEDTIRVAELKIRPSRFARVRAEVGLNKKQILEIAEFMHPRTEEIADTLPAFLGRLILNTPLRRLIDALTRKGRRVKTTSLSGFLLLYLVASFKPIRPRSLRYEREQAALEQWLSTVLRLASGNYDLAVEVASLRGLVKGYGDTYERGRQRFEAIVDTLPVLEGKSDGVQRLTALRKAANADDTGVALAQALKANSLPLS